MANDLTGNPLTVDTAAVIRTGPCYVIRMSWGPAAAGDDILVSTNDGSKLFDYKAIAGNANGSIQETREIGYVVNGINVETIDTGTLTIHIR